MSFNFKTEPFGSFQLSTLGHESGARLQLVPGFGGMIHDLSLVKNETVHSLLTTSPDPKVFETQLKPGFNGSFLAPFPNRLAFGKYVWQGESYKMEHNDFGRPNALHGFTYELPFEVDETKILQGKIDLSLNYEGDREYYPFPFLIQSRFKLTENKLQIITEAINKGNDPIPFGIGWHPYFNLGKKVDQLHLQMPCDAYYEVGQHLIPTTLQPFNGFQELLPIDDANLDTCYRMRSGQHTAVLYDPEDDISIRITQDPQYGYAQYYIPEDRKSIAIEPMTCAPDAFNSGNGLLSLDPGQEISVSFEIELV